MAMATAVPARRPQEAVLRELLLRRGGWEIALDPLQRVATRGRKYLLIPLARGEGWRICLCEAPRRPSLPPYADRRELHLRTESDGERSLTVFTDASGMRQVRAWTRQRPFGDFAYTEEYRSTEGTSERTGIRMPAAEVEPRFEDPVAARGGAEAALAVLTARLQRSAAFTRLLRGGGGGLSSLERLQRMIERSRTPEIPRRVWAEVQMMRILDSACGSGSWLGGCLLGLGAVAAACLQRMQPWVEDAPPGRADRYADFRRLTVRSRELARCGVRDRLALEMVLLRCLHGVEEDVAAAARCRRALAAHLSGGEVDGSGEALADVRTGRLMEAMGSGDELADRARQKPAVAAVAAAIGEEAEALARAEEQLVRMRLRGTTSETELSEGRREIQRRRQLISRLLTDRTEAVEQAPPLHVWIEYNGVVRAGGFHLVRGQRLQPSGQSSDGSAS